MFLGIQLGNRLFDVWPISVVAFFIVAAIRYRRGSSLTYLLFLALFWLYCTFALNEVFFPIAISGDFAAASRVACPNPIVNLIPFSFGPYPDLKRVLLTNVENIVLTLPFGFGLPFLVAPKRMLLKALVLGSALEATQYLLSLLLGYCYRVVDINDVLMNALGVLVGYGIFLLFTWGFVVLTRRFHLEHVGLSAYLYHVAKTTQNKQ